VQRALAAIGGKAGVGAKMLGFDRAMTLREFILKFLDPKPCA
jgi:hypothetical protein